MRKGTLKGAAVAVLDPGTFERLAAKVLRRREQGCAGISDGAAAKSKIRVRPPGSSPPLRRLAWSARKALHEVAHRVLRRG